MNKTEIQARIEKCESEIASLKADLAKCEDGIEQEKCWHAIGRIGVASVIPDTLDGCKFYLPSYRPAYMPECRQVTAEDALDAWSAYCRISPAGDMARELHKLGFRMKVTP